MSILSRRFLGRARLFQELVEDWRTAPNHALFEREVGELIVEAKEIAAVAQAARDTIKKRLKERNPENIELEGIAMKQAISRIQAALTNLEEINRIGQNRNLKVADSEWIFAANTVIENIRDDLNRWFPVFTPDQVKEAIAAVKRGETITMEEVIHEARNAVAAGS